MIRPELTQPSDSERARALKRLKKIFALSESDNPGEAAAALQQARSIMRKYELHESDVAMLGIEEAKSTLSSVELSKWESALIGVVAKALGVAAMLSGQVKTAGHRRENKRVIFVGESCRSTLAVYAFEALRRKLRRDTKATFAKLVKDVNGEGVLTIGVRHRNAYAFSWCASVQEKVKSLAPAVSEASVKYIEGKLTPQKPDQKAALPKAQPPKKIDPVEAFMSLQGLKDGRAVDLYSAVGKSEDRLALGA